MVLEKLNNPHFLALTMKILTQNECPECGHSLHKGQHKFSDGIFEVFYCKNCGYRKEIGE